MDPLAIASRLPQLTSGNYAAWKRRLFITLKTVSLHAVVDGTEPCPKNEDDPRRELWLHKADMAYSIIA